MVGVSIPLKPVKDLETVLSYFSCMPIYAHLFKVTKKDGITCAFHINENPSYLEPYYIGCNDGTIMRNLESF